LAAVGYSSSTSPAGTLRLEYFLGDGGNEHALGFNTDASENFFNTASGGERNFYLLTVSERRDAVQPAAYSVAHRKEHAVTALGNGALINYNVSAEVGQIPKAIVDWEGSNVLFTTGSSGFSNPAISKKTFCPEPGEITLPPATTGGMDTPILRPEDISLDFGSTLLPQGGPVLPGNDTSTLQEIYIRNFDIDVPLDSDEQGGLGIGSQSQVEVPVDIVFNCSAWLTDIHSGNLISEICNPVPRDITVNLKPPCLACSGENPNPPNMKFIVKGAVFDSQTITSTLSDAAVIDLNFTTQLGGKNNIDRGLLISGTYQG
jgi:hypothetical protein